MDCSDSAALGNVTDQRHDEIINAIRERHLKANIGWIEDKGEAPIHLTGQKIVIHWERAWIDPGGTIFGNGPYLHVPITGYWGTDEETVHRVYPPERLRRKLARLLVVDDGHR